MHSIRAVVNQGVMVEVSDFDGPRTARQPVKDTKQAIEGSLPEEAEACTNDGPAVMIDDKPGLLLYRMKRRHPFTNLHLLTFNCL